MTQTLRLQAPGVDRMPQVGKISTVKTTTIKQMRCILSVFSASPLDSKIITFTCDMQ